MNNNKIITNNDITSLVKINETNNNNVNSIHLNNNHSDLTDKSLNNVIELKNYKPSMVSKFSTTNNESVNQTNKRRNVTLNIRH